MNIIFGKENIASVDTKYIVLELDTIRILPMDKEITAYCLVEHIAVNDLPRVQEMKNLHTNLMENYKKKDWNYCQQAMEHLIGFWGGEVDTFYGELQARIADFVETDPGSDWNGVVNKVVAG